MKVWFAIFLALVWGVFENAVFWGYPALFLAATILIIALRARFSATYRATLIARFK